MVTSDGRAKVLDFGVAKLTKAKGVCPANPVRMSAFPLKVSDSSKQQSFSS